MNKEDLKITDWLRILVGEAPPVFFLEIILRAIVVYAILMVSFRLLGSRMASRLNRIEQASLVTLAAAIGVPIQSPERGIIPPVIVAIVVVFAGRLITRRASRNENFEHASQGKIDTLVEDHKLCIDGLRKTTLTRERIFAQLRNDEIIHLGEVKRLYIESNGSFTLLKEEEPMPGLAILPECDQEFLNSLPKAKEQVCLHCGNQMDHDDRCNNCGYGTRVNAVAIAPNGS